jgi:thiol-disulfide isomerase/thioredoxin
LNAFARALQHRYMLRGAVIALLLALTAYGLAARAGNRRAPPLPAAALSGRAVTLAELRGHPEVLAFWASWCRPCHTEAPALERFARSAAGRGRILAIDHLDPLTANARAFIASYHWSFPVLSDPDGRTGDAYGVSSLPTTVILNARGEIVARASGPQTVASLTRALRAAG